MKKINLYVDGEMFEWIKESAKSQRRSMNSFVLLLLDYFREHPEISGLE